MGKHLEGHGDVAAAGDGVLTGALLELVGELSSVMFSVKDADGRYTRVNDAFVRRTRERSAAAVLGRTAAELFEPALAERYTEQDAQVLATGKPLHQELELIRRAGGAPGWYLTNKAALPGPDGPTGVVALSEDLRAADADDPALTSLARVAELVQRRLDDPPRLAEMASAAGCSASALERRVRRVYGLSPTQLVLRARIDTARELLTSSTVPLAEIALRCGFYDQPSFTRQFTRLAGETPGQHRRRARRWPPPDRK